MANTILKAGQIVRTAQLLLQREIVLPRTVWRQAEADFIGKLDDTVTLRVPTTLTSRKRTMRSNSALSPDEITQTAVPVKLDSHLYSLLNITDEELTLDLRDFTTEVLVPQVRAVVEGLEDLIADELAAANHADEVDFDEGIDEPFNVLVDARKALNDLNVPRSERVFVCGSAVEAALLKDDKINKVNESGTDDALREAVINRLAGFTIIGSNALGEDEAYAYHRTAVAFASMAPVVPAGAADGGTAASEGLALRYLRDYNPTNSTGPVDRSLVDMFAGATSVERAEGSDTTNDRIVKINFTAAGTSA